MAKKQLLGLRFALPAACVLLLLAAAALALHVQADLQHPRTLESTNYVGSQSCKRCHPAHYASFHRTYHRTMTQLASPQSVLGTFDGTSLDYLGVRARMHRGPRGEYMMSFTRAGGEQRWSAVIERSVGSHRYQQYLARNADVFFRLPIAWDVGEQRFIHMNGAFLTPDPERAAGATVTREDYDRHVTRWNDNCVFCHNVHPNPGLDPETGRFETHVAELGVACEACHGPGAEHAARNANPLRRYALHATGLLDPTIRNPARMPAQRSAEVCGRCHGQRITSDIDRFHHAGDPFVPGDNLERYSKPLARDTRQNGREGLFRARFWSDGTPRLTAYEYQGFLQSPCARSEHFSCESCHAMHAGDPSGQLRPELRGDQLCTSCHAELNGSEALAAHSHHPADSSGSRCVHCHMPNVVYGLVSVKISHRIEVPAPAAQAAAARPDACTLCHVDRSRAWATQAQQQWNRAAKAQSTTALATDEVPEQWLRVLAGDPIQRAVAAAALGEPNASYRASYRPQLVGLLLDVLSEDPYPAVRAIAQRSLRAVLQAHHPTLVPRLAAYRPTDTSAERSTVLRGVSAALGNEAIAPDPRRTLELRALATSAAIEIGE